MKSATLSSQGALASTGWVTAGFLYIYLAWGGTYLAVHIALESMPPFLLAGCRFLLAGTLLLALLRLFHSRSFHWGNLREWKDAAIVGTLIPVMGNGIVAWAQVLVPSGLAALLFGSMPLWIILFDWIRPHGVAPTLRTVVGLILGLIGVFVLVKPEGSFNASAPVLVRELALLVAACSWAAGGIYSRHVHARGSALLPMARQMMIGGILLLVISTAGGSWERFSMEAVTVRAWISFAYLVIFGSLIGFTVYVWLMRVSVPARVATISYVNLLVAVLLGWGVLHEPMTPRLIVGGIIILASVALVLKRPKARVDLPVD